MFGGFACEMTPSRRQDKLAVSTQSKHCFAAIPWCGAHAEPRRAGLVSRRCFGVILSRGAVRTPNPVGEGLGPPVAPSFHYLPVEIAVVFAVLFEAAKAKFAVCEDRVCLAKNAPAFL